MKGCSIKAFGMAAWEVVRGIPYATWLIIKVIIEILFGFAVSTAIVGLLILAVMKSPFRDNPFVIITTAFISLIIFIVSYLLVVWVIDTAHDFRLWIKEKDMPCTSESFEQFLKFKNQVNIHFTYPVYTYRYRERKFELGEKVKERMEGIYR